MQKGWRNTIERRAEAGRATVVEGRRSASEGRNQSYNHGHPWLKGLGGGGKRRGEGHYQCALEQ